MKRVKVCLYYYFHSALSNVILITSVLIFLVFEIIDVAVNPDQGLSPCSGGLAKTLQFELALAGLLVASYPLRTGE